MKAAWGCGMVLSRLQLNHVSGLGLGAQAGNVTDRWASTQPSQRQHVPSFLLSVLPSLVVIPSASLLGYDLYPPA